MRNKGAFWGLLLFILLALAIIGFEIYNNGRTETIDRCNGGDYPYSNWFYRYDTFAWHNVEWSKIFGSAKIYIDLHFLLPFFIYFTSKIKGRPNGLYRSIWLKIIMVISSIPLFIILLSLLEHSLPVVTDYDTDRDPTARNFVYVFFITTLVYDLNMFFAIVVYLFKVMWTIIVGFRSALLRYNRQK